MSNCRQITGSFSLEDVLCAPAALPDDRQYWQNRNVNFGGLGGMLIRCRDDAGARLLREAAGRSPGSPDPGSPHPPAGADEAWREAFAISAGSSR
jgi:hypothetical protein